MGMQPHSSPLGTSPSTTSEPPIRILVVEDERIIAVDLRDRLQSMGYLVVAIASTGEKAIQKAAEFNPALVLMDIRLKHGMDGIQAAEQIWNQFQIPVIYVTGHSDRGTLERAKVTAPFGYILKPVKESELYIAIESAIRRYEREQWLSIVLRGIGDGVIAVTPNGRVDYLNPVAEAILGWRKEMAKGLPLDEVFCLFDGTTHERVESPVSMVLQQQRIVYLAEETLLQTRDGRMLPIADSAAPFRDKSGNIAGVVIVFRDITERQMAREQQRTAARAMRLESEIEELQQLNQIKDDFLSTVSHELRSPLASIRMSIQLLQEILSREGALSSLQNIKEIESVNNYLSIISSQCEREIKLVNDLLEMQQLNAGVYTLNWTLIQLQDWIPHLLDGFETLLHEKEIQLSIDIAEPLPPIVSDSFSLNRVLIELMTNALKYTPSGESVRLRVQFHAPQTVQQHWFAPPPLNPAKTNQEFVAMTPETSVSAASSTSPISDRPHDAPQPTWFEIQVVNTGAEILSEDLPRIFEPFYRGQTTHREGSGMGLALVKNIVEYLEGSVSVESSANITTFTIRLPQYPQKAPRNFV